MSSELMFDSTVLNIPDLVGIKIGLKEQRPNDETYSDDLVFSSSGKVFPIRAETNAADIKVAIFG